MEKREMDYYEARSALSNLWLNSIIDVESYLLIRRFLIHKEKGSLIYHIVKFLIGG